jgi:hypothetical protein
VEERVIDGGVKVEGVAKGRGALEGGGAEGTVLESRWYVGRFGGSGGAEGVEVVLGVA